MAANTKSPKRGSTFRVRGVPLDWEVEDLRYFLTNHEKIGTTSIKSLADEIDGRSKTATVTFQKVPTRLQGLRASQPWSIELPNPSDNQLARTQYLSIDGGFLGITTLCTPPTDAHEVDIIALPGLGGHAFGSFKERGGDYMWLRDSLPEDVTSAETGIPIARVMIYGYESGVVQSQSVQNLEDLGTSFHASLLPLARRRPMRPIILLAHSLGGLIIKQTLVSMSKSKKEDDLSIVRAVYGIVFFGVPHDGMDTGSVIPMVRDGPNRFLIESISRINSQILSIQRREFHNALGEEGDSEIVCFYETKESPTAKEGPPGKWTMTGPSVVLVTKASATHCRQWEDGSEHICAVARTHSDMVKFNPMDHEYANARERLKGLAQRALASRRQSQNSNTKFLVPYQKNDDFVERPETFREVQKQLGYDLRQGVFKQWSTASLLGLRGSGKTQIALAYVYWLKQSCPDVSVFWVHASTSERFYRDYSSIAQKCEIPGYDDPQKDVFLLVKNWLEEKYSKQWLMVIQNADDPELFFGPPRGRSETLSSHSSTDAGGGLGRYIPECPHGSILVTTTNKQVGLTLTQEKLPVEIGNMTDEEAYQLLCMILKSDTTEEIPLLLSRIGNLPLELAQAAALLEKASMTIREYVQLLDKGDSVLAKNPAELNKPIEKNSDIPYAFKETCVVLTRQIERQPAAPSDVAPLMNILERQNIPEEVSHDFLQQRRPRKPEVGEVLPLMSLFDRLGILKLFLPNFLRPKWARELDETKTSEPEAANPFGALDEFALISEGKDLAMGMCGNAPAGIVSHSQVACQ